MGLKYTVDGSFVTVTCGDESLTIAGAVVRTAKLESGGSAKELDLSHGVDVPDLDVPHGIDVLTVHFGLPTVEEFTKGSKVEIGRVMRRMTATKGFQDLVKLGGKNPVVMVVKPGAHVASADTSPPFATVHEQFKLK